MTSLRDQIRESNRLTRMRQGQAVFEPISPPSLPHLSLAQVTLSESETQLGVIAAANLDAPENMPGMHARNRAALTSDAFYSLRDPADLTVLAFESVEEMVTTLEPGDIDYISDALTLMMEYASPSIDGLSVEALEELKKAFGAINLSELTGRRWAAVKLCLSILLPELLQVKLSGSTSTEKSTETSASAEST